MTALAEKFPTDEPPHLVRAVLRLVTNKEEDEAEKLLQDLIIRIESVSTPETGVVDVKDAPRIQTVLARMRTITTLLQEVQDGADEMLGDDALHAPMTAAISAAIERISARRAYLAWVIDENDDRELGREITLPEPTVAPGPSSQSFQW